MIYLLVKNSKQTRGAHFMAMLMSITLHSCTEKNKNTDKKAFVYQSSVEVAALMLTLNPS